MARVAAEVPDVLVASDGPEPRRTLVHWVLGPQPRQDLVVVVPDEERSVPRVDRRVDRQIDGRVGRRIGRRIDPPVVALVADHGASVLCSAMRTEYDSLSFGGRWLTASRSAVTSRAPGSEWSKWTRVATGATTGQP